MTTRDPVAGPRIERAHAAGHPIVSLVADGEPRRAYARALDDLAAALPPPDAFERAGAQVAHVATTPDFHPGRPVPVGVVLDVRGAILPHVVGSDIGCGMRLLVLRGLSCDDVERHAGAIARHLRHVLFQGGRDIALTGHARHALLGHGLPGLLDELVSGAPGILGRMDFPQAWADLDRTCDAGYVGGGTLHPGFKEYVDGGPAYRRDAIAGSLGGGNHFLEIGAVERIVDGAFARAAGVRAGDVTLCVHSGSLDLGQHVGAEARDRARADGPIVMLGTDRAARYVTGQANAVHFAYGNRLLLGLAACEAIWRATGKGPEPALVYDAAHNAAWIDGERVVHRKGACPARGPEAMRGTPYEHYGEPVILPGSMGDATWLLRGLGANLTGASSAHGAGRRLSRGQARREVGVPTGLRVVGPVDLRDPALRGRPDVLQEAAVRLAEEAPGAYRPVEAIVAPMEVAGVALRVARIVPLMTAKG